MADFNPPPLFSSTGAESSIAETESVIITHGEIRCSLVDPEIVLHVYIPVDPDPNSDTVNSTNLPPPHREPEQVVQQFLYLSDVN